MHDVRSVSEKGAHLILNSQFLKREAQGSFSCNPSKGSCVSIFISYFGQNEGFAFLRYTVPLALGGLGISLILSTLAAVIRIVALSILIFPPVFGVAYQGCLRMGWDPMLIADHVC